MTMDGAPAGERDERVARLRRAPPAFRHVKVRELQPITTRLRRVTFAGPELEGYTSGEPAASVRLLLPEPRTDALVMPQWNGNEFLLPDGRRPTIRTFTPLTFDPDSLALDLEIVIHGSGRASDWATTAAPGAPAAISGPGRGYTIDSDAPAFLLAGDETALPAIHQLLDHLPAHAPTQVHIEVGMPEARIAIPARSEAAVEWHGSVPNERPGTALVAAVRAAEFPEGARIWAAGEAAAMQRIRRHLFEERGIPRPLTMVRGYWKHGRAGDDGD
jgi:NADPH-dependent ferric siderophore reductase